MLTVCRGGHGLSDLTTDGGPGTVSPAGLGHEGEQGMPTVQYAMDHRLLICVLQTGPYSDVFYRPYSDVFYRPYSDVFYRPYSDVFYRPNSDVFYRQGLTVMCFTDRALQ